VEALNCVQDLSLAAKAMAAITHVKVAEGGRLVGDNIRWLGVLETLRSVLPSLAGLRPLIIGAGDAAQSVVYALAHEGLPLTILDSRIDRAIDLVHRLRHVLDEHSFSIYRWPQDLGRLAAEANLIVNATDIGTWPDADGSPWPDDLAFPPGAMVLDMVPWPSETRFVRQARNGGAKAIGGLAVSVCEMALAFEMWTGLPRPIDVVWQATREVFRQQAWRNNFRPEDNRRRTGVFGEAASIIT
jgi:shikimate dehydrogenase